MLKMNQFQESSLRLNDRYLKTAIYYLTFVLLGMCVAILGPTLPDLAANTKSPISHLSILFTARSLGYLIGAYVGGRIYDEVKGHPVISITLFITAGLVAIVPMLELLGVLILIILLLGISESVVDVGGNTLLVWIHKEKIGTFMNGLHFFFGVGGFIAPLLVAQVILYYNDISWAYWLLALSILPLAGLVLFVPSPSLQTEVIKKSNGDKNWKLILALILFFFLWVGAETGFGGWIYTYGLKTGMVDKTGAAYITSAFWGAFTLARLLSVALAIKLKPVQILFLSLLGTTVSVILIATFSDSYVILLTGTIGVGAFMAPVFPTTLSFSERRMTLTGKITSFFFVGAGVGGMSIPWLAGQYIEISPVIFLVIISVSIVSAFFVLSWISFGLRPKIAA